MSAAASGPRDLTLDERAHAETTVEELNGIRARIETMLAATNNAHLARALRAIEETSGHVERAAWGWRP